MTSFSGKKITLSTQREKEKRLMSGDQYLILQKLALLFFIFPSNDHINEHLSFQNVAL